MSVNTQGERDKFLKISGKEERKGESEGKKGAGEWGGEKGRKKRMKKRRKEGERERTENNAKTSPNLQKVNKHHEFRSTKMGADSTQLQFQGYMC